MRRSTIDQQSRVKDRFDKKESVQSSWVKKEVVKQVYRVKKDGRKCAVSDLALNNEKPAEFTLATKGKNYKLDCKRMWVPVKSAEPKPVKGSDDLNIADGLKIGERQSAKSDVNGIETSSADGSVQGKSAITEEKALVQTVGNNIQLKQRDLDMFQTDTSTELGMQDGRGGVPTVSSSASLNVDSIITPTNSATASISSAACKNLSPYGFKSSTAVSTQRGNSSKKDGQRGKACDISNQQRLISAKERTSVRRYMPKKSVASISSGRYTRFQCNTSISIQCGNSTSTGSQKIKAGNVADQKRFSSARGRRCAPRNAVCHYRPRNSGGNIIISVAPGTKSEPQWCPSGLTPTQKRRVQRLRASEIREQAAKKKRDRDRPMVPPKMIWK